MPGIKRPVEFVSLAAKASIFISTLMVMFFIRTSAWPLTVKMVSLTRAYSLEKEASKPVITALIALSLSIISNSA